MLGSDVCRAFERHHEVLPFDIEDCDISDESATRRMLTEVHPDLVIHCAAYTDVDGAEREKTKALRVNGLGTRNVTLGCQDCDATLVYVSTDYVFDGRKKLPYVEEDDPNPLNVYGRSKLEGEEWIRRLPVKSYIVRTAWLYGRSGSNFIYKILRRSELREFAGGVRELPVVDDQVGSPTYTLDLAKSIVRLVSTGRHGLYHLANAGHCSWYEFAGEVFRYLKKDVKLRPIDSRTLRQPARRPPFSALESSIWGTVVGESLRNWNEALPDFLTSLEEHPQATAQSVDPP